MSAAKLACFCLILSNIAAKVKNVPAMAKTKISEFRAQLGYILQDNSPHRSNQ
jgi:hypothetical protein